MDRKEFLSALGLSAGAILLTTCLGGCKKESDDDGGNVIAPSNVNFNLDLSLPANAALNTAGGYVYANGVIVAKTTSGTIIAVSQACTHAGTSVQFVGSSNQFYCPNHGAKFNTTGGVTNGPATSALKQYAVTISGNIVTVVG
ncbi:MAG: Rieske (2Fe-2S) protein [Ferruginibacter sp.]|nr:Rieske (2Fe-2S) protein [Ferruginibacter sp.]